MKTAAGMLCILLLAGCASDAYYKAIQKQYEARMAGQGAVKPLVDMSWTDVDGNSHHMTVNLPPGYGAMQRQEPRIPAPWEGWFRFYDRTLTSGERFLPWFLSGREEHHSSQDTTYTLGDNSFVLQTPGDGSSIDLRKDNSTITNPAPEAGK